MELDHAYLAAMRVAALSHDLAAHVAVVVRDVGRRRERLGGTAARAPSTGGWQAGQVREIGGSTGAQDSAALDL